jgi:DNA-binding CsgD family transcriptional regulator
MTGSVSQLPEPALLQRENGRSARRRANGSRAGSDLRQRLTDTVTVVAAALGQDPSVPRRPEAALELLETFTTQLLGGPPDGERLMLVARVRDLHAAVREEHLRQRHAKLAGVQQALEGLRDVGFPELIERTPQLLAATLGFDRVLISQVHESTWTPLRLHVRDDPAAGRPLSLAEGTGPEQLTHVTVEAEILRRRVPLVALDVQRDAGRLRRRPAALTGWRAYVAAPIMPEGKVIGLLHADYHLLGRDPDDFDRDMLSAFAAGFGQLLRAAALDERLRIQADQVRTATETLNLQVSERTSSDIVLAARPAGGAQAAAALLHLQPLPLPPGGRLELLLTPREREVMQLLATGARNHDIAARLVISEGTVKSHVKHILRKLGAATRGEAVSKYMRLAALSGPASAPAARG